MAPNPEQQAQWYCRRSGEVLGPLSTSGLEELIRQHALGEDDAVRLGTEQAWMPVSDVQRMFALAQSDRGESEDSAGAAVDAAHAAAAALSKSAKSRLLRPAASRPVTRRAGHAGPSRISSALDVLFEFGATTIAASAAVVARVFRQRAVQMGIAAALLGLFVWKVVLPRIPIPSDSIHAQYQQLWQDIQAARDQADGAVDWDGLERRVAQTVAETRPHVSNRSSPAHAECHELVLAADLLPVVLEEARAGERSTRNEGQLANHLRFAEQQLTAATPPLITRLHVLVFTGWAIVAALMLLWMLPPKSR